MNASLQKSSNPSQRLLANFPSYLITYACVVYQVLSNPEKTNSMTVIGMVSQGTPVKLEAVSLQDVMVNLDSARKRKVGVEWNRASLVAQKVKRKKESACSAGDVGSTPGSARSSGGENGNPLQYSCLGNSVDRGASGYSQWGHKELYTTKQLTQERTGYQVRNQQGDDQSWDSVVVTGR